MVAATYATDSVGLHAEVMRLHTENTHLREIVDTQLAVITDLKAGATPTRPCATIPI
jgi:hypothetical protein